MNNNNIILELDLTRINKKITNPFIIGITSFISLFNSVKASTDNILSEKDLPKSNYIDEIKEIKIKHIDEITGELNEGWEKDCLEKYNITENTPDDKISETEDKCIKEIGSR